MANINLTGSSGEGSSSSDANGANSTRPGFNFVAAGDWSCTENSVSDEPPTPQTFSLVKLIWH